MKYILFFCLFFVGCSKKFIQKPQKIADFASPETKNNVLYISDELQKYDIYGPLLWFALIIATVMLLAFSSLLFKDEHRT